MTQLWEPGTSYSYNDVVEYEGHRYKIIQPHRSQGDWTPPVTPALWGRMQDGHGGEKQGGQHHEQQQQQQPQQQQQWQQPQQSQNQGGNQQSQPQNQSQQNEVGKTEVKKHWYDMSDERKQQVEIGGGLLAGVAAIGAGYYAYKEHENNEEEKKAQTWALSNWLNEARSRSDDYRNNGPRGPAAWVLTEGKNIPNNAILVGEETKHGWRMYSCRAFFDGGVQLGKASDVFKKGGVLGYQREEIHVETYEILVGDMNGLRWVQSHGRLNVGSLGARPVEGGRENDGSPLYIARGYYKDATIPGKCSEKLDGAWVPYDDKEKQLDDYQVLCYA